ncbi:MAG: ribosomal protein small subunit ribosomal protein [Patescibacteria group bacterium]|nr:ribosomal protein small subunit ribosomal protein [Patescibacteria group bacterium]
MTVPEMRAIMGLIISESLAAGFLDKKRLSAKILAYMPNLQNAKKALRVSDRKKVLNDKRRRTMKETVKAAKAVVVKDAKAVGKELALAYQAIDKAAKRGIIKPNAASRKKSRLAKAVKKSSAK